MLLVAIVQSMCVCCQVCWLREEKKKGQLVIVQKHWEIRCSLNCCRSQDAVNMVCWWKQWFYHLAMAHNGLLDMIWFIETCLQPLLCFRQCDFGTSLSMFCLHTRHLYPMKAKCLHYPCVTYTAPGWFSHIYCFCTKKGNLFWPLPIRLKFIVVRKH